MPLHRHLNGSELRVFFAEVVQLFSRTRHHHRFIPHLLHPAHHLPEEPNRLRDSDRADNLFLVARHIYFFCFLYINSSSVYFFNILSLKAQPLLDGSCCILLIQGCYTQRLEAGDANSMPTQDLLPRPIHQFEKMAGSMNENPVNIHIILWHHLRFHPLAQIQGHIIHHHSPHTFLLDYMLLHIVIQILKAVEPLKIAVLTHIQAYQPTFNFLDGIIPLMRHVSVPLGLRVNCVIDSPCNFICRGHAYVQRLTFVLNVINVAGNRVLLSDSFVSLQYYPHL